MNASAPGAFWWDDPHDAAGYKRFIGAIVALNAAQSRRRPQPRDRLVFACRAFDALAGGADRARRTQWQRRATTAGDVDTAELSERYAYEAIAAGPLRELLDAPAVIRLIRLDDAGLDASLAAPLAGPAHAARERFIATRRAAVESDYADGPARRAAAALAGLALELCTASRELPERSRGLHDRIAEMAYRALLALVEAALHGPQHRLAAYGSLRRGQDNHHWIDDLGTPDTGAVCGETRIEDGFPVLRWEPHGALIPVEVYSSALLTPVRWHDLDAFEGAGYRRIVVPVRLTGGGHLPATIFADAAT